TRPRGLPRAARSRTTGRGSRLRPEPWWRPPRTRPDRLRTILLPCILPVRGPRPPQRRPWKALLCVSSSYLQLLVRSASGAPEFLVSGRLPALARQLAGGQIDLWLRDTRDRGRLRCGTDQSADEHRYGAQFGGTDQGMDRVSDVLVIRHPHR